MTKHNAFLLYTLASLLMACQDNEPYDFRSTNVSINGIDSLTIDDSLFFIVEEPSPKEAVITSDPSEATLYLAVNHDDFQSSAAVTHIFAREDTVVQFYFAKKGFHNSPVKTIVFSSSSERFLSHSPFYPNPFQDATNIMMTDKSRGMMGVIIYNMTGKTVAQTDVTKQADTLAVAFDLKDLPDGTYIAKCTYGQTQKTYRLLKTTNRP